MRFRDAYGRDDSRSQAHIFAECRLMNAVRVSFGRLDYLSRLFANDVGVIDDAFMAVRKVVGLQLHQHAILSGILSVAQQHDIAVCMVVSEISAALMVGFLPRNPRPKRRLVEKCLAATCRVRAEYGSRSKMWCRITSRVCRKMATQMAAKDSRSLHSGVRVRRSRIDRIETKNLG